MKNQNFILFLLSILLFLNPIHAFPQGKQANIWHFGYHAGLNFNTGSLPSIQTGGQTYYDTYSSGVASISDSTGNLLFYGDGKKIWNKLHVPMTNGDNLGTGTTQGAIIVPNPGNSNEYYYFNFGYIPGDIFKFQYSVVDMSDGLGHVVSDKKAIFLYHNTSSHLSAVKSASDNSIWVICHERNSNCFLAYKVTSDSLCTIPVKSYAGNIVNGLSGYMKISPNGQILGLVNFGTGIHYFNILSFNPVSGEVSEDLMVYNPANNCYGCEFSPDNSKFYILGGFEVFYQYDLKAGDAQAILDSQCPLSLTDVGISGLQLGPDGKIYLTGTDNRYLGVINYPNKLGMSCNFIDNAIYLGDGNLCYWGFPSFIQSYLNDPEFSINQHCLEAAVQFHIEELNGIDSVEWKFNDPVNAPNDTSTLFSPLYTFSSADTFYVELTVHSGFIEKTVIDTVIIYPNPTPDLGIDTAFCANEIIDLPLDAGPGQTYSWNGAFPPTGNSTYQVTGPGMYTVQVNDHSCAGRDTINVIQYQPPVADITGVAIGNATCGGSDGSIAGIVLSGPPYTGLEWQNSSGTVVGTGLDLTGMPAGIYSLYVYYGNDCALSPFDFEIINTAAPQITGITPITDHCSLGFGELQVNVLPGPGSPYTYSLDGVNFTNSAGFTGLMAGDYTVTVMDVNGCTDAMPVTVPDTPGPQVTDSIAIPENGYAQNGMITITATGDSVYYSLDGGTPQPGITFSGLSAGDYTITVTDKWGCERLVFMTVDRLQGVVLSAVAGNDYKCMNELAYSTLSADNFIDVKQYKAVLVYNNLMLRCTGYNPAAGFAGVVVTDYNGSVEVEWQSDLPVTLPGNVELADLIFEATDWGVADIKWDTAWSVFRDSYGNTIASSLNPGVITINNPPFLQNSSPKTEFCEGEQALIEFNYSGGTDPVNVAWQTPDNANIPGSSYAIDSIKLTQAGAYTIFASDVNNCKDTLRIPVTVYAEPTSGFEGIDTIWFEQSYRLEAKPGYANYEWSTGDTIYYITVTNEGEYSVLIETSVGCTAIERVFMFDAFVPINVPNAFTPNGDGLNDTFRPVVNTELIRRYHLTIYNKWGQLLFETSTPGKGWNGENAMAGVYVWVIDYENRIGKRFEFKGMVSLIK